MPLLKGLTIHWLPLSISTILFHLNCSNLLSISLHHSSGWWSWRFQCPCSPDPLMLKTLQHADYYEHLSASSATWPLWPNLQPKLWSEWPHLQKPRLRASQCLPGSPYLLPLRPLSPSTYHCDEIILTGSLTNPCSYGSSAVYLFISSSSSIMTSTVATSNFLHFKRLKFTPFPPLYCEQMILPSNLLRTLRLSHQNLSMASCVTTLKFYLYCHLFSLPSFLSDTVSSFHWSRPS